MATSLLSLPDEILVDVFDSLPQKDLHSLASVSSRLANPAQRILYRSICLLVKTRRRSSTDHSRSLLLRTFSENPRLQSFVLSFSIRAARFEPFDDFQDLLCLMPRLQQLSLVPAPVTLRLEALPSSIVNSLRLAEFSKPQKEGEEWVDALVAVARNFWRANLRRLQVEGCSFPPASRNLFPPERYGTSSITSLTLSDCNETMSSRAASSCVTDIIRCIKRLQHFSIDYYTPWDAAGNWKNVMQPWHFAQLLGPHASTLETIEIGTTDAAQFPNSSLMGSLAGYCKLKRLLILETFLGQTKDESWTLPDVLPHSIEEFQLQYPEIHSHRGPDKDLKIRIKRMEDLAAAKLECFPALKRVVWWYQPTEVWYLGGTPNYGPESDMDYLGAIFAEVGVKFDWLAHYEFRETPLIKEQEKWWDLENKYAIEDE